MTNGIEHPIPPALTGYEWNSVQVAGDKIGVAYYLIESDGLIVGWSREQGTFFGADDLPVLAALANAALPDGDPRKITRADEEILRGLIVVMGRNAEPGTRQFYAPALKTLAAKLAALLPPDSH